LPPHSYTLSLHDALPIYEHLEQFNEKVTDHPTPDSLGLTHPRPLLVAIRNPRSMSVLERVLRDVDPARQDVVAITCKVLPALTPDRKSTRLNSSHLGISY